MLRHVTTHDQDLNPARLQQELIAAGLPVEAMGLPGYEKIASRQWRIRSEPFVYSRKRDATGETILTAQPGEIHVAVPQALTPAEEATLASALTAHNFRTTSDDQDAEDQDIQDRDALKALLDSGNNPSPAQLRRLIRLVLRRVR